jgi:hypothetical protein
MGIFWQWHNNKANPIKKYTRVGSAFMIFMLVMFENGQP